VIGTTLAHYRIVAKIGEGGMGEVYRAHDTRLDRDVALKVLPPDAARNPERRARFEREAKAVAALQHPNLVTIHSVEESEGTHFLTMELVEGRTLSELVPEGGFPPERFLEIAVPLVDAVACAHAKGIAHRDLKPANIMVDPDGRLKVLDFGLAKLWDVSSGDPAATLASDAQRTGTGTIVGTPAYMSPEQIAGDAVDARSDVFSLGIVFHELLGGTHPFADAYPAAVMVRIVKEDPAPLTGVPDALAGIVARCLRKDPAERFADASELGRALRDLLPASGAASTMLSSATAVRPDDTAGIRDALARNAWEEAYLALHALADRRPLSADEMEMLAEAAAWMCRWDEWVETLENAQAAFAESGRSRDAGRIALELVACFVEMKKPAASRGWLKRAERLLREQPECAEQGFLLRRHTIDALAACDFDRAAELNRRCAEIAERTGDRDLEIVALHDRGQILVARGDVEEGTTLIDEAMAAAMGGDVSQATLGVLFCRTLIVCRSLADFDRAREWTEEATRWTETHAASAFRGICRVHSAETMRHHGHWKEAEQAVREACEEFGRTGPASHAGEAFNELGELELRKGDFDEAEEAFRRAHEFGYDPVPGLPLLRLAQGKGAAALQMIGRALGESPDQRLRRAKLLAARILIALAQGENSIAETDAEELATISADFHCPAFRAQAALGRGAVALARGDEAATHLLREAWSTFHGAGLAYDAARARVLLARAYRASGDEEDARLQLDAARKTFTELGARPDVEAVSALLGSGA